MNEVNLQIFLAALQGLIANPTFFGYQYQGSPEAAVEFARSCVKAAYNNNPNQTYPNVT